jgi:hypothetical protein
MKEPPDKYRTLKCPLKTIIKKEKHLSTIMDTVIRTHKLTIHVYQLLRLWLLDKYNDNDLPNITTDTIKMAYKVLSSDSAGPKPKGTNLIVLGELQKLYDCEYKNLGCLQKLDASNLSQIISYSCVDIMTNIENNIKIHYIKYINRFVNSSFKKEHNEILEQYNGKEQYTKRKELRKELYDVKKDLQENTLTSNEKYHKWIKRHRPNITPTTVNDKHTLQNDIECHPQKYLKNMIYMCIELEDKETKLFQFFPLRTDIIPKYIPIDTKSIIELLIKTNKNEYLTELEEYKESIWDIYFNINNKIFKQMNYEFDYRIMTDGLSVSIQMINKKYVGNNNQKKTNMKNKRKANKEAMKDMTEEEKAMYKEKQKEETKKKQQEMKIIQQKKLKQLKEEFKKLPLDEKRKLLKKECPYLEDLTKEQIEELKKCEWVCCDPGKNYLLYFKSSNGIIFRYSNKMHLKRTKRLKYQTLLKNYKDKKGISKIENELSKYNSKTCNFDKFKEYIKEKNKINEQLFEAYEDEIFRKYKWYGYINRKRTEANLVNDIKTHFNENIIIILGDWSKGNEQKGIVSTPNKGLKKILTDNFTVYSIDEFRTSKLNCKTEEVNENISLPDRKNKLREIHSILTFQMENNRMGCINRDSNAVNNMVKLVKYFLETGKRILRFCRDYDLETKTIIKDGNPQKDVGQTKSSSRSVKCHHAREGAIRDKFLLK